MDNIYIQEQQVREALRQNNTPNTRAILENADLYAFFVGNLNATLELASGKPMDVANALVDKGLSTTEIAAKSSRAKGILITTSAMKLLQESLRLAALANKTTGGIIVNVGATLATKMSIALGMAGGDDKKAKCLAAYADMAAGGLTLTGGFLLSGTGFGTVGGVAMIVGSLSQIALGAYEAHKNSCGPF